MNKTILTIALVAFTGVASASAFFEDRAPFNENADLYGGSSSSVMARTAVQPGVGDTYGGSVFTHTELIGGKDDHPAAYQGNDSYASPIPNVEEGTLSW